MNRSESPSTALRAPNLVGRGVLTAPRAGGLRTAHPTLRFLGREHLQNSDVNRSHEPGRRLQSGTGFQPVSPEQARCLCHFLRFMESFHGSATAHWDHELDRPRRRPRNRVGQSRTRTKGRFMEREELQKLDLSWGHERWGETPSCPNSVVERTGLDGVSPHQVCDDTVEAESNRGPITRENDL